MVYPATTSCNWAPEAPSSVRIVGAATFTMKMSSMAMNWAVRTTASSRAGALSVAGALLVTEREAVVPDVAVMRSRLVPGAYG
ncbi:hypothetical protein JCM13580A_44810 [Streptomyces drozdowiczii]